MSTDKFFHRVRLLGPRGYSSFRQKPFVSSHLSHLGCTRGQQVRGIIIGRGGGGLNIEVCETSRTASVVVVPPVMCAGRPNMGNDNSVKTSQLRSGREKRKGKAEKRWLDNIVKYMRVDGVCIRDVKDRDSWRFRTRVTDPEELGGRRG
ncbi:hypothetical protein QTP88_026617 [Uroleucon formosanum]